MTPTVTRENLGAWLVRCNPRIWDLEAFISDGGTRITEWSVADNYRSALMAHGQRVVFWVSAPVGAPLERGIWGSGWITGPAHYIVESADDGGDEPPEDDGYWIVDHSLYGFSVPMDVELLLQPIPAATIKAVPGLEHLEVLVQPQISNPSWVSKEQLALLDHLLPRWPVVPPAREQVISVGRAGAGFGDPLTTKIVELAAMKAVAADYENGGWTVEDISSENLGWDLTCTAPDGTVERVEVKGVSGPQPTVLITSNEVRAAREEGNWYIAVVTRALTAPSIAYYAAEELVRAAKPYVYRAALPVA